MIVPSIGRPSLAKALYSCEGADEILVGLNADDDLGYGARNRLMAQATGTHLVFLDDDDRFVPEAFDLFRAYACDRPVIFRMKYHGPGGTLWHKKELVFGNVGSPMLLIPNVPGKLGRWAHINGGFTGGGDYVFAKETCELQGAPLFVPEVVAVIRPWT